MKDAKAKQFLNIKAISCLCRGKRLLIPVNSSESELLLSFAAKTMTLLFSAFAALISVMNPLGTVPIFVALTQDLERKERNSVAKWAAFNVLFILLVAFFLGKFILIFFGIGLPALRIAGGLIIASSGFALLGGNFSRHKGMKKREKDDAFNRSDITLTPLAIPMLAGPGTISLLITYYQENERATDKAWIVGALVAAALAVYLILSSSQIIARGLGASGITALGRIIGFIIIAIGIEYLITGLADIIPSLLNGKH